MDFPIFHADFFGNRFLIAFIGITHILINHAFAVGLIPLLTAMEWWAYRKGRADWDQLLYRILFVAFVVTTTAGALTGVGIWFSTAIVNPQAVGSLLRVFYWAWFAEWVVFVAEVVLILFYFLTWKHLTGERKPVHIRIGVALSVMSWLTMAIITGILGFMMNPGEWIQQRSLLAGFLNPVYIPQLFFRTALALALAGSLALALTMAFTARGSALRQQAVRIFSGWALFWTVPMVAWGLVYHKAIPTDMLVNMPVAFGTQAWADRFGLLWALTLLVAALIVVVNVWGVWKPSTANAFLWLLPILCFGLLVGQFERARQFIRKPYVIGYYMFSNGVRVSDVPYILKTGLLQNSSWAGERSVNDQNKIQAGRDVFMLACSRCHTLNGINAIRSNLTNLYPGQRWEADIIDTYLKNIHGARAHMPPFVGTAAERNALAEYLVTLQDRRDIATFNTPARGR
jgi:hypothetical protein